MYSWLDRAYRIAPVVLGIFALAGIGLLLAGDAAPGIFPAGAHKILAAFPLAMIAIAYLVYQSLHRPPFLELMKAVALALAFLFWAANQLWPDLPQAVLFNDLAVALFVADVFIAMTGRPANSPDASSAAAPLPRGQAG